MAVTHLEDTDLAMNKFFCTGPDQESESFLPLL